MGKKIVLITLLFVLGLSFSACGQQETEQSTEGLDWPSQYMSSLPEPDSTITSIDKLKGTETISEEDTTTQPSSVNVVMNEMTLEEANAYYDELKSAGFTINTDQNDKDQIMLVGVLNDADSNPFLFSYLVEDGLGNVSITILNQI
jgi:hypothetical protein